MCSRRFGCVRCNQPSCSHNNGTLCIVHCWEGLKCSRCDRFVRGLVHNLIFYHFQTTIGKQWNEPEQTKHDEKRYIIDRDLKELSERSDMYDIISENWKGMERVFEENQFMSKYDNAEEWRSALKVLWTYFDLNGKELAHLELDEFKKSTGELLNDFLSERYTELLYLLVPNEREIVCVECVEVELSDRIKEMIEKKPTVQAISSGENYSKDPQWLIDDILGHVLSYLIIPRDLPALSLTCKRFYYFLHYSTNFSWVSNLTLPNRGKLEIIRTTKVDFTEFMRNIFKTYQGFTNLSTISKVFNLSQKYTDDRDLLNTLFLHKLLKRENATYFENNLDSLLINTYKTIGLGFLGYYWIIKRNKKVALKYLVFEADMYMKCFALMMILKNVSLIIHDKSNSVDIDLFDPSNSISFESFNLVDNELNLNETGLGGQRIFSCLPGDEGQYYGLVSHCTTFNLADYEWSNETIPKLRNDLVIGQVWAFSYNPKLIETLINMESKGITIHTIILDPHCYNQFTNEEKKNLLKLKGKIEIGMKHTGSSLPPTERWTLKSVIQ